MELPNLGKHCGWPLCKALDFLPFTCSYCKIVFCKDHYNVITHECQSISEGTCDKTGVKTFICSYEECNSSSPVEMKCPKCENHFCLTHRYHTCFNPSQDELNEKLQLWNAPRQQFAESVKDVHNSVNEAIKKAKLNPKKKATALKIQLMRLKGKAEGLTSIPSTDRVYFLILLPSESNKCKSKPVFVSKDWSIGRIIDSVASTCNVSNKNNEMNSAKLRLFKFDDGTQLSYNLTTKLTDLLENKNIADGETLILEYVNPSEDLSVFNLVNFADYSES